MDIAREATFGAPCSLADVAAVENKTPGRRKALPGVKAVAAKDADQSFTEQTLVPLDVMP